jgi:hypothetical protein
MGEAESVVFGGKIQRIGRSPSLFHVKNANKELLIARHTYNVICQETLKA